MPGQSPDQGEPRATGPTRPKGWVSKVSLAVTVGAATAAILDHPLVTMLVVTVTYWVGVLVSQRDTYEHVDWVEQRHG